MKQPVHPKRLYEGCLQAAIAHAVAVGKYPELNFEHSWDGINYCTNDGCGRKAAVTFHERYVIAVFCDAQTADEQKDATDFFDGASAELLEIAQNEALQYMLERVDGVTKPVITAAVWGTWEQLCGMLPWESDDHILRVQLLPFDEAMEAWRAYYDLDGKQVSLVRSLFQAKVSAGKNAVFLQKKDLGALYGDQNECLVSLKELNILQAQ